MLIQPFPRDWDEVQDILNDLNLATPPIAPENHEISVMMTGETGRCRCIFTYDPLDGSDLNIITPEPLTDEEEFFLVNGLDYILRG